MPGSYFDLFDAQIDPRTTEAARKILEEQEQGMGGRSVDLAPPQPAPGPPPVVDAMTPRKIGKPGQSREEIIAELKEHQAMTDSMRNTPTDPDLLSLRQQELAPSTVDTARKIREEQGAGPFPWKDVGGLDQGYARERAKEMPRELARGGPRLEEPPTGDKEPFEIDAESQAARDRKVGRARGLKDVAEGLGNMDFRGFGAMSEVKPMKPYKTDDLRRDIDRAEGTMTPEEIREVKKLTGVSFPTGTTWDDATKLIPSAARIREAGEQSQDRLRREDDVNARADTKLKEARRKEARGRVATERGERLKPGSSTGKLKEAINAVGTVETLLKSGKNAVSVRAALVQIAKKLAGDSGVLTQQDIEAYEGNYGIPGLWNKAKRFATGDFTESQIKEMAEVAQTLGKAAKEKYVADVDGRNKSFYAANKPLFDEDGTTYDSVREMVGDEGDGTTTFTGPDGQSISVPNSDKESQTRLKAAGWK